MDRAFRKGEKYFPMLVQQVSPADNGRIPVDRCRPENASHEPTTRPALPRPCLRSHRLGSRLFVANSRSAGRDEARRIGGRRSAGHESDRGQGYPAGPYRDPVLPGHRKRLGDGLHSPLFSAPGAPISTRPRRSSTTTFVTSGPGLVCQYLELEVGIQYNRDQRESQRVLYTNPSDLFLNGVLDTREGTCGNMAALQLAFGWRLGWPVSLACVNSHFILRFDDGQTTYNIEATQSGQGASSPIPTSTLGD